MLAYLKIVIEVVLFGNKTKKSYDPTLYFDYHAIIIWMQDNTKNDVDKWRNTEILFGSLSSF